MCPRALGAPPGAAALSVAGCGRSRGYLYTLPPLAARLPWGKLRLHESTGNRSCWCWAPGFVCALCPRWAAPGCALIASVFACGQRRLGGRSGVPAPRSPLCHRLSSPLPRPGGPPRPVPRGSRALERLVPLQAPRHGQLPGCGGKGASGGAQRADLTVTKRWCCPRPVMPTHP